MNSEGRSRRNDLVSEFGKALLKINALRIGTFETSSGEMSPYFIDLRKLASFPAAFALAFECFESLYTDKKHSLAPDYICGIPTTGLLFGTLLAFRERIPLIYPSKSHPNSVVGLLRPGARVLIVNDVSETGFSIKAAIQAIRASGGVVNNALTLIDRSEGADKTLSEMGAILHYFTTTEELVKALRENMALADEQISALESR
ncbi:MAG: orotate phosphoribosyltransferase [Nitrososphaerales archaeon]